MLIVESLDFCPTALERLRSTFDVELADLDRAELLQSLDDCEYLWVRLRNMIDAEVLSLASCLKGIITNTTGLNHIDTDLAASRNIAVISLKGELKFLESVRATAEHTLALTLGALRQIHQAHRHVCTGNWDRNLFKGREIYQSKVGVIGYGRLGKLVAQQFSALGARVCVTSSNLGDVTEIDGYPVVSLERLLSRSDIVSLHANFSHDNLRMIGPRQFGQMQSGSLFVNTARGELVDEAALLAWLQNDSTNRAAIDVVDGEHNRLGTFEQLRQFAGNDGRLLITPHIGGNTFESTEKTEIFLAEKVCRLVFPAAAQR